MPGQLQRIREGQATNLDDRRLVLETVIGDRHEQALACAAADIKAANALLDQVFSELLQD